MKQEPEIIISNKIRIKYPPDVLKTYLIKDLQVPNPKFETAQKNGYSTYGIPPYIRSFSILPDDSLNIPTGYRVKLLELLEGLDIKANIKDVRHYTLPDFSIDSSAIKLRDYQAKAITSLVTSGTEGLLVAPAGSGKTVMGISLVPMLGQTTLWLTHTRPLLEQALERLNSFLPGLPEDAVGVIGNGKWSIGKLFTVAMVQTLVRRPEETHKLKGKFGLVILDEAHHSPATTFTNVLTMLDPHYMYGLTATHIRRDGLHELMYRVLGPVLYEVPLRDVKRHGGIIVPQVWIRRTNITCYSDNFQNILGDFITNPKRNNIIVADVLAEANRDNICAVMTERTKHADILYSMISSKWAKTGIATGAYSDKHNSAELERLRAGEITVLVTTSALLGEGFDHAPINRGFICLPFRNMVKTEQIIGRIQRTAKGKDDAVIYDYVDSHSLCQHQFRNSGSSGCRYDIYTKLGCSIRELM